MIDDMFRLPNGFERLHQASSFEKNNKHRAVLGKLNAISENKK